MSRAEASSVMFECAAVEGRHHEHQRLPAAERNHEARQEQQMVRAVEDVRKAQPHESQRGLVPARIERDHARIARELEPPDRAIGSHAIAAW